MTVQFAANESGSFLRSGSSSGYDATTAGRFDPLAARSSLFMTGGRVLQGFFDAAQTTYWFQGRYYYTSGTNENQGGRIWTFKKDGQNVFSLRHDPDNQFGESAKIFLDHWSSGGWVTQLDTAYEFNTAVVFRFTGKITIAPSGGRCELWDDEVNFADFTGNTAGDTGETDINNFELRPSNTSGSDHWISEIMIDTEDPRAKRVVTLDPVGNGFHTAWTNDVSNIDEIDADDLDVVYEPTANDIQTYDGRALNAAWDAYSAEEVRVWMRSLKSATGPQNIQMAMRSGGADFVSPSIAQTLLFNPYSYAWVNDPNTAAAWLNADVNSMEYGQKAIA